MFSETDVIAVLGKRGHGKTTLSQKIQVAYPRLVILDRLHEYPVAAGDLVCTSFDGFADAVRRTRTAARFKILIRFDIEASNHDAFFNEVLRVLYYRGSVCIVIEEVHNFATPHYLPHWFRETLLTGRHRKLALITTTQRPAELHKTLLSQCAHIFAGNFHEKNDVNYLSTVLGDDAPELSHLKIGHFLHYRPGEPSYIVSNQKQPAIRR